MSHAWWRKEGWCENVPMFSTHLTEVYNHSLSEQWDACTKAREEMSEQNKRERGGLGWGERERERHTHNCIWKNISWVNTELRIEWEGEASRSGHGNRSGWWKMGGAVGSKGHWLVTSRLASRTLGTMCGRQRPSMSMTLCSLSAIRDTWERRTRELDARMSPQSPAKANMSGFSYNHTCLKITA